MKEKKKSERIKSESDRKSDQHCFKIKEADGRWGIDSIFLCIFVQMLFPRLKHVIFVVFLYSLSSNQNEFVFLPKKSDVTIIVKAPINEHHRYVKVRKTLNQMSNFYSSIKNILIFSHICIYIIVFRTFFHGNISFNFESKTGCFMLRWGCRWVRGGLKRIVGVSGFQRVLGVLLGSGGLRGSGFHR